MTTTADALVAAFISSRPREEDAPTPDRYEVSFERADVPPGATAKLIVRVDRLFFPLCMRFDNGAEKSFFIEDIRIGGRSQFINDGCDAQLVNAWEFDKQFETCHSFMRIKVVFTNTTDAPCSFHARLIGAAYNPVKFTGELREHYQRNFEMVTNDDLRVAAEGRRVVHHVGGVQLA